MDGGIAERLAAALEAGEGGFLPDAGPDDVTAVLRATATAGRSIYLMGEDAAALATASLDLVARHPGIRLAGSFRTVPGLASDAHAREGLGTILGAARPDVLLLLLPPAAGAAIAAAMRDAFPAAWWVIPRESPPARPSA